MKPDVLDLHILGLKADISNPAKLPDVYRMWVDFVFLEFYNQGDLEKQMGLPVSYLCDRTTTNINISQLGFINFIVEPTFDAVFQIIPEIYPYLDNGQISAKISTINIHNTITEKNPFFITVTVSFRTWK